MKRIRKNRFVTHRLKLKQVIIGILFLGIFAGVIFANLFRTEFFQQAETIDSAFMVKIKEMNIEYVKLLQFVLIHILKPYALIWIFSITILGIPYIGYFIIKQGFSIGFVISVLTMNYGIKGIILFLSYIFPQYIIYIPVFTLVIYRAYNLNCNMYFTGKDSIKSKKKLVLEKIPLIILLTIFIIIGCLIETYINSFILKNILSWVLS